MIFPALTRVTDAIAERITRRAPPFTPSAKNPFPAGAHPLDWNRSGLGRLGKLVVRSATEAILCDVDEHGRLVAPDDATLDRVVQKVDLWVGTGSTDLSRAFGVLVGALEAAPMWIARKPARFTKLPLADRLHILEKLEEHPVGLFSMLVTAFKVPLATAAFEEDELLHETGFDREDLIVRRKLRKDA
ncbi:MAG TPA: hypothetical protein VL400_18120 [Polyangiaceae bacterium]|jgi:hypothetical protein|nr:hypothetical protein [Polyangiaceae bacterium]